VLRRSATSLESDGSRREVVEMEDRRQISSPQVQAAAARIGPPSAMPSQMIIQCEAVSAGHNNGLQIVSRDTSIFDVV